MAAVTGIGNTFSAVGSQLSRASLEAKLARDQQQLADCVNCPSSKTSAGKANIDKIAGQIGQDKQLLQQADTAAAASQDQAAGGRAGGVYTRLGTVPASSAPGSLLAVS